MVRLLNQADWGEDRGRIQRLKGWVYYPPPAGGLRHLAGGGAVSSAIHGPAHIHRVLLLSALVCQGEGVRERMVRQVFRAASYYDVGRTFDGYDVDHGARSALRLAELTGQTGRPCRELQAAVTAHARPDREMEAVVASFHPPEPPRALELTRLLKDARTTWTGCVWEIWTPGSSGTAAAKTFGLCRTPLPALSRGGSEGRPGDQRTKNLGK